jgi:hypothetical protein
MSDSHFRDISRKTVESGTRRLPHLYKDGALAGPGQRIERGRIVPVNDDAYHAQRANLHQEIAHRLTEGAHREHYHGGWHEMPHGEGVTVRIDRLADGLVHPQAQNASGLGGVCTWVACEQIINRQLPPEIIQQRTGHRQVTEQFTVQYALEHHLTVNANGGGDHIGALAMLEHFGLKAQFRGNISRADYYAQGFRSIVYQNGTGTLSRSSEDMLESAIEHALSGTSVMLAVRNDQLYTQNPQIDPHARANHVVILKGDVRVNGELAGIFIDNSSISANMDTGEILTRNGLLNVSEFTGRNHFIPLDNIKAAWLHTPSPVRAHFADGSHSRVFGYAGHILARWETSSS